MSILLSILMIVGLFTIVPVTASAEDIASGTCGTCQWEIDEEGTLTIHAGKLPMK